MRAMSTRSWIRGHFTIYNEKGWLYEDTLEKADDDRRCAHCHEYPTEEGYDHCLGFLPGVKHACCGHGIPENAYVVLDNDCCFRGHEALEMIVLIQQKGREL